MKRTKNCLGILILIFTVFFFSCQTICEQAQSYLDDAEKQDKSGDTTEAIQLYKEYITHFDEIYRCWSENAVKPFCLKVFESKLSIGTKINLLVGMQKQEPYYPFTSKDDPMQNADYYNKYINNIILSLKLNSKIQSVLNSLQSDDSQLNSSIGNNKLKMIIVDEATKEIDFDFMSYFPNEIIAQNSDEIDIIAIMGNLEHEHQAYYSDGAEAVYSIRVIKIIDFRKKLLVRKESYRESAPSEKFSSKTGSTEKYQGPDPINFNFWNPNECNSIYKFLKDFCFNKPN
jgi:hypothetical protein